MNTSNGVGIDAAATVVWDVFVDVERWAEWTASIDKIVPLDGPGIEVGKRFEIKQPRMPKLVWEVTSVDPGVSFAWRQKSLGGTTVATHEVISHGVNRTLVRQSIDQRGPVGVLVGMLMIRLTKRYLDLEAKGLKARCEQQSQSDAPPA